MSRSGGLGEHLLELGEAALERVEAKGGRFTKYAGDPVGFSRDVFGFEPWATPIVDETHGGGQVRFLEALPKHAWISIVSGNGIGKTKGAAVAAWWWLATRGEGARCFLTSTKGDQTQLGIWHEARKFFMKARDRGFALGGTIPKLGKTGWEGPLGQQLLIVTADKAEALQSTRAEPGKTMFVADEASGIEDRLFEAIEGNLSAGGLLFLIGNPMVPSGYFYESQKEGSGFFRLQVPSTESPYVDAVWLERMRKRYGEDHPVYIIRVKGQFLKNEEGRPLPWQFIEAAQLRYRPADPKDESGGLLQIGIDPAGPGEGGDEWALTAVRGDRFLDQLAGAGWDEDTGIRNALDMLAKWRGADECPRFVVDSLGPIGGSFYGRLSGVAKTVTLQKRFTVHGVRSSDKARREPHAYTTVRDELFSNLAKWVRAEGTLPPDVKLEKDLHEPMWEAAGRGLLRLTPKDELRKKLDGRSPDRGDSLALAVWLPSGWHEDQVPDPPKVTPAATQNVHRTHELQDRRGQGLYGSLDWARPRRNR